MSDIYRKYTLNTFLLFKIYFPLYTIRKSLTHQYNIQIFIYFHILKISLNPKLSEVLDEKDIETIEKLYKEKIERIDRVQHKNSLKDTFEKLREINVDEVGTILDDLDGKLPERLKKRLMAIYYKKD